MGVQCKCKKELITKENKIDFTVIVSAVDNVVEVIDCYKCSECKTVVGRKRKYDKETVLNILNDLECKEIVEEISGNLK